MSLQPLLGLEVWRVCGCLRFALIRVVAQCEQLFCAALVDPFDMAAPIRVGPTLLSIVSNAEMEDIISTFMADDKFIVLVAQANSEAHRASRVGQRRFTFALKMAHGYTGIAGGAQVYRERISYVRCALKETIHLPSFQPFR